MDTSNSISNDTNNASTGHSLVEDGFGPAATARFDFAVLFEVSILSILPSALFLVLAPQRLLWMRRKPRKVVQNLRLVIKLTLAGAYTILQLAILLYLVLAQEIVLRSTTAAAALVFVSALLLVLVTYTEHVRSVKPSTLISVYLLLTLIFDCAITRTAWLLEAGTIAKLYTSATVIKFSMLLSEAWEKRDILLTHYRHLSPEVTSGILGRAVFWWLNPLMRTGFRRILLDRDIYPIHQSMAATKLLPLAQSSWNAVNQARKNALFFSTMWANKYVFSTGVVARLCLIAFRYTQPFLIHRTTSFIGDLSQGNNIGWGLTGAWLLVFLGLAVSNAFYYHMTYRFVTSVRGSLCALIYNKTLRLSLTALDESIAVTLMSTDTELICRSFATLHEVWASPIECGLALYLLYRQLGLAFLAPMVVALVATIGILQLANYIGSAQKRWVRGIQTRVDVTACMLGAMKEIKILGLSDILYRSVQNLRVRELKLSKTYRKLVCFRILLGSSTMVVAPLATFATFVVISQSTGTQLNVASAYTSLSLIYLLSEPMVIVIRTIPMISTSLACFDRVRQFLLSGSHTDHRIAISGGSHDEKAAIYDKASDVSDTSQIESHLTDDISHLPAGTPLIQFSKTQFRWTKDEDPTLTDVSCIIHKSQFTFIIGDVGSGKSTLMKAMLGELGPDTGYIHAATNRTAFAGQNPWIQNLTIRKNIIGTSCYEKVWYDKVVYACGLQQDIVDLLDGDQTVAGSAGFSLSGGQKQRLALARAVYSRRNVIFLDDVFSGQDAATEEHIYHKLLGSEGLLRSMGTTLVCVTNTIHRLSYADHIIALGEKGRILHQGSFEQLQADTSYLHGLQTAQNHSSAAGDAIRLAAPDLPPNMAQAQKVGVELQAEQSSKELAIYSYYFRSVPSWYLLLFVALILIYGGSFKMTELLLSFWTSHTPNTQDTNKFYVGMYGMLSGIAMLGITGGAYFFLVVMVPLSSEVLHHRLLKSVINAPLSFFSKTDVGVVTNRFSQDMSVIDTELPWALIDLAINLTFTLMALVLMCVFSGYFAATLPPIIFFCWVLQKFYLKTSRQVRILDLEAKSPLFTQFLDLLQGLATVRAFAWQEPFQDRYLELLDASQRVYYLLFCIQRWLALVLDIMVAILATIIMVMAVKLRSQLSSQLVALALLNVTSLGQSLSLVIQGWTLLETSFGAVARVEQFCSETPDENLTMETSQAPPDWPAHGHISLDNLTASYTQDGDPVLQSVSLDIPSGYKVAICGRSGSGKSSLVACLLRLLEISQGSRITIDGIDITTLPRQSIREAISVVPQHPFFLKNSSIRQNLVPRGELSDENIISALSRLKMLDIVLKMGGLDSVLDEDRFSQGQRQMLCLARALLTKNKIVLLDEPSSNVDERSERVMWQAIREEFADRTIVAVVHRLGAVRNFDAVAVMSSGRLIEWDNPDVLLGRDSEFRRLWNFGSC